MLEISMVFIVLLEFSPCRRNHECAFQVHVIQKVLSFAHIPQIQVSQTGKLLHQACRLLRRVSKEHWSVESDTRWVGKCRDSRVGVGILTDGSWWGNRWCSLGISILDPLFIGLITFYLWTFDLVVVAKWTATLR